MVRYVPLNYVCLFILIGIIMYCTLFRFHIRNIYYLHTARYTYISIIYTLLLTYLYIIKYIIYHLLYLAIIDPFSFYATTYMIPLHGARIELTTTRLTAVRSTIELPVQLRIIWYIFCYILLSKVFKNIKYFYKSIW